MEGKEEIEKMKRSSASYLCQSSKTKQHLLNNLQGFADEITPKFIGKIIRSIDYGVVEYGSAAATIRDGKSIEPVQI
jgi:hypothetical protein